MDSVASRWMPMIRAQEGRHLTIPTEPIGSIPRPRAAGHIPTACLGTTDDCGFAPFADDTSTSRELAFAKVRARVVGTRLAAEKLGWSILTVHHRGDHESYIPGAHAGDAARS